MACFLHYKINTTALYLPERIASKGVENLFSFRKKRCIINPTASRILQENFLKMNLKGNTLTAVMDLILDYPVDHAAFIGFFMTDTSCQKKGVGSGIINAVLP